MEKLKKTWKNEYIRTGTVIGVIVLVVFGLWYGTKLVLNTQYPALAVASGSMCIPYGSACDGWSHPFKETLHVGDLIIVQGIAPEEVKASSYPTGDIIVFQDPSNGGILIVHRAIAKEKRNGEWYFQTKGDGNSGPDSFTPNISEDRVRGKVILRIPWVGHIALFMRTPVGIYVITFLLVVLVILEFVIPTFSSKTNETPQDEGPFPTGFS